MLEWIKNIAMFLVAAGLLLEMLAETKYYKFVRWVVGIILILQLMKPFADTQELWERFITGVRSFEYAVGTERVLEEIYGASEEREESVLNKYKGMIEEQVATLLKSHGVTLLCLETEIGTDGTLLNLYVYGQYETEEKERTVIIPTMGPIAPVSITENDENKNGMMSPFELYLCEMFSEFYRIEESRIRVEIREAG